MVHRCLNTGKTDLACPVDGARCKSCIWRHQLTAVTSCPLDMRSPGRREGYSSNELKHLYIALQVTATKVFALLKSILHLSGVHATHMAHVCCPSVISFSYVARQLECRHEDPH